MQDGTDLIKEAHEFVPQGAEFAYNLYRIRITGAMHFAVDGSYAQNGKADLAEFQEGLRATHDPDHAPSHNTILGHSYGTTLIGYAARDHGIPVLMGSPGTGVDNAKDLLPNDNVYAATAPEDPIPWASPDWWYGPSPADPNAHFGALQVPVNEGGNHETYWADYESRRAMAQIVAGKAQGNPWL